MVKLILKSIVSQPSRAKRVRGIKSRTKPNNSTQKKKNPPEKILEKPFDMNYYSQPKIDFLLSIEDEKLTKLLNKEASEFSESRPDETLKYKQEHRALAIIGLKDMICQIVQLSKDQVKIPDNFIFNVISLFGLYIQKSEKDLSKNEMIKSLYSCLMIIDQFENIQIFTAAFFKKITNANFKMDISIINMVNMNLFPIKIYDYFDIFFLRISQENQKDKNYREYIKLFKDVFIEFNFYITFHENSKFKKPSINFISCLIMTYCFIQSNLSLRYEIVEAYINHYKNKMNYDAQDYFFSREIIKESKKVFDDLANKLNVNNLCRKGLIDSVNINCI